MAQLTCIVVTPEKTALERKTSYVVLPLYDGEIGIAPLHSPLIGQLGFGEMRLRREDGGDDRFYLDGGFVQVAHDVVTVLTSRAVPASALDVAVSQELVRSAARRPANSPELLDIRDREVARARAQLRVARRAP